jgi:DNA-binding GntR family transcriptional regulator
MASSPTRAALLPTSFQVERTNTSLRAQAVNNVRRAILSSHFKPGTKITARELCDLTGTSHSLMREVLRDLESEGLITNVPHRSPIITVIGLQEAREIYEVRRALEPQAAKDFIANARSAHVELLSVHALRCRDAMKAADVLGVLEGLENFYQTLFDGAGNALAASLVRIVYTRASLLRAMAFHQQSDAEMRLSIENLNKIVKAVVAKDEEAAIQACLSQIERSWKVAQRLIAPQGISK